MAHTTIKLGDVARLDGVIRRPCWRKAQHATRDAAIESLTALLGAPHVREADRLNVYACQHCGCWHVGHRLDSNRRGR